MTLELDLSSFERAATQLGGAVDQVPFAISQAMNGAAFATRKHLTAVTWPQHVTVRKPNFITAALRVETASKQNPSVVIKDVMGRANLIGHAKGNTKRPKSGRLAIPTPRVRRGSTGVVASQRPGNLRNKVVKGGLIFQRQGRGKNAKLQLMYKLAASARQPKDVPFIEDFNRLMMFEIAKRFPEAMARAMATRR